MTHIFISYAKKDTRELALNLADALSNLDGVTAWVDRSLRAGRSWELQIQAEIDRCDTLIVLYSPDINRHKEGKKESYVLNEIGYAKRLNKLIIPIMAQETTPPLSLINDHYIDFLSSELTLNGLVEKICGEIGIEAKAPVGDILHDVFISYSHEDREVMRRIAKTLKDAGFLSGWMKMELNLAARRG